MRTANIDNDVHEHTSMHVYMSGKRLDFQCRSL